MRLETVYTLWIPQSIAVPFLPHYAGNHADIHQ